MSYEVRVEPIKVETERELQEVVQWLRGQGLRVEVVKNER